jgi:hypothetical protein
MKNAFSYRPFARFRLPGEFFGSEAAHYGFCSPAGFVGVLSASIKVKDHKADLLRGSLSPRGSTGVWPYD